MKMKIFYAGLFWAFFSILIGVGIRAFYLDNLSLFKDICLPVAALLFTAGQLWRLEKDHGFETEKHTQQRKDQYWDKRLNYYVRLRELVGTICYDFSIRDIEEAVSINPRPKFTETKLGKIYRSLMELEFEGEILFTPNLDIGEIRENFEIIRKKEIEIASRQQLKGGYENDEQLALAQQAIQEEETARQAIDSTFKECKKTISSYLKQE
jgi:hypothetical protein